MENRVTFRAKGLPYLLVLPQMVIIFMFFFWPAGQALLQSFYMQDAFGLSLQFVGLENFSVLFTDSIYLKSIGTSFLFSFFVTFTSLSSALFLAVIVTKIRKRGLFYKTMIIWPYAVAPIVAGVLWMFLFNPTVGIISYALKKGFGIGWNHILNGAQAFILVVIAASWKQISYNFLFFTAGLQNIPETLLEAAAIDGASPVRRFWGVVFPLLKPTTFYLLVMNIVYAFFETFGIIQQVTAGGPGHATNIMVFKVYRDGFLGLDLGSSSAQSVILMAIVIILTLLQFRFIERKIEY
ncbi:MAG: sn-glycerol-3-phosphate ABC transporter permease UgpA [Spirochaetota bacterium]